jgi:hypothetical protein
LTEKINLSLSFNSITHPDVLYKQTKQNKTKQNKKKADLKPATEGLV